MKKKTAKRALLSSVLALLLCVSMLVGTTFAWFTDSVTSAGNIIKSGTLDVTMHWADGTEDPDTATWNDASTGAIFNYDLWEPGYTEVRHIKIANVGNLALKYKVSIMANGEVSDLADVIDVYYVDPAVQVADRAALNDSNRIGTLTEVLANIGERTSGSLEDGSSATVTIALKMQESAGNEYQGKSIGTDFSVVLNATQYTFEDDSFDKYYDEDASWWSGTTNIDWYLDDPDAAEFVLTTGEELAGLAAIVNGTAVAPATTYAVGETAIVKDNFKGKTIKLGGDINLCDIAWTPIGDNANPFLGNFDGQGYTVYNLFVANEGWSGLIGHAGLGSAVTISNVNIDGVTIFSNRMAGAVVGQVYGNIDNCHVKNADIMVTPNKVGDSYDNGDKVGGIVGWLGDNGNNRVISNCSAENVKLGAYRDVGGIVGYVASSTTLKGNSASKVTITVDQSTNYYGDKDVNAGYIYGRANGAINEENNTAVDSSVDSTYSKNGLILKGDGDDNVVLYKVPEAYADTTVNIPEGVTAIGGYAFAYNANVEKIVLPSSVTTLNDRAFRDTSASEVVLNEGLTNISYQAFRNATNVTTVVIPSTVTKIAKEAFQNSGITTLTIPAGVTTLEYGACRDMKELVSVVIEGNVDIPVYAFRACAKLESVNIKGDNVTFGGGSRGMIFTNKENGDGSQIKVTVVNETVKQRLLDADTAAKDYGGYEIIVDDTL